MDNSNSFVAPSGILSQELTKHFTPQEAMQRASPSVASADMRPPPVKPPNPKKNKTSSLRGQTPSERSSTSSRSRHDLCFICAKESNFEKWSLVTCCQCKRKYHRGCSRGYIPRPCPLDWTCYLCNLASTDNMQPAAKRRKIESPVPATVVKTPRLTSAIPTQEDRPKRRKYDELIGMALHDAPNHCLSIDQIFEWIIDNVSEYYHEDRSWKDGIWVALAENNDFVYQYGDPAGLYTFREDAVTSYRQRDQSIVAQSRAGASLPDIHHNHTHAKQGGNASKSLASDHGPADNDFKPPQRLVGQAGKTLPIRAGSEIVPRLPSSIDTFIDLTLDEDEELPPVADSQVPQKSAADRVVISLLDEMPQKMSEKNQRSSFAGFGEPTWMKRTSITPTQKSLTPFTDRILETASASQMLERFSGTEKWKTAHTHVNNLLASPPRTFKPTDRAQTSMPRSPRNPLGLKPLSSQPPELIVVPSREISDHDDELTKSSREPIQLDLDDATHDKESQQPVPDSVENNERSDAINHGSNKATPAPNDKDMPMDLDQPDKSLEVNSEGMVLTEPAQISDDTIKHTEPRVAPHADDFSCQQSPVAKLQPRERLSYEPLLPERFPQESLHGDSVIEESMVEEPITEKPIVEEPITEKSDTEDPSTEVAFMEDTLAEEAFMEDTFAEESFVEEQPAQKTPASAYVASAAQTDSAAAPSLTLGNISHVSLEPQVPVDAILRKTADSTTQTEHAPQLQLASHQQSPTSKVPSTATEEETTVLSLPWANRSPMAHSQGEEMALELLKARMYPPPPIVPPNQSSVEIKEAPEDPLWDFDHEAKMKEIRARPTRKQIFGKVALSRVAGNDALTRLNKIVLGKDRLKTINVYKGYTEEQIAEEKRLNAREGYYETMEELLNMPDRVVPFIHEGQLAFRDYTPATNGSGRMPRAKHVFKLGPNVRK